MTEFCVNVSLTPLLSGPSSDSTENRYATLPLLDFVGFVENSETGVLEKRRVSSCLVLSKLMSGLGYGKNRKHHMYMLFRSFCNDLKDSQAPSAARSNSGRAYYRLLLCVAKGCFDEDLVAAVFKRGYNLKLNQNLDQPILSSSSSNLDIALFSGFNETVGGGMGRIYFSTYNTTEPVVLKCTEDSSGARELFIYSGLSHPNVASCFGYTNYMDKQHIVIERCPKTLSDLIESEEICLRKFFKFSIDLFRVLNYLHTVKGLVHSDIKPENLLISEDERLKLFDFGLTDDAGRKLMAYGLCASS